MLQGVLSISLQMKEHDGYRCLGFFLEELI